MLNPLHVGGGLSDGSGGEGEGGGGLGEGGGGGGEGEGGGGEGETMEPFVILVLTPYLFCNACNCF